MQPAPADVIDGSSNSRSLRTTGVPEPHEPNTIVATKIDAAASLMCSSFVFGPNRLPVDRRRIAVGVEGEPRAATEGAGGRLDVVGRCGGERGRRRCVRVMEVHDAVALGVGGELRLVGGERRR